MTSVGENWQTKCSTVSDRTKFIFNGELLSDVKFVVPVHVSNGETETKEIPAHKFVLAISSPVFYAMFYGKLAENTNSVELPDCEYESVLEFFRFLYSDEVFLTESNVMHVLYLAKKYMVPSLAEECTTYLQDNLEASNVFSILPNAQKFEDKALEDRCWEVIETHTEEAVTSDEFVTLERSLVESVVKREKLRVKEVELFKTVDRWATKESEKQGTTPDGKTKRRIIGEEILKEIRFPLMLQKEFASAVFDSNILTIKEIGDLMKHYSNVSLMSPLPFVQTPRIGAFYHCHRFEEVFAPADHQWGYTSKESDKICVSANKPIWLHGVQHFGSEGGEYTVCLEVKDAASGSSLAKQSGTYPSENYKSNNYYGYDVLFNCPVHLLGGKTYMIASFITGPKSWYGGEGKPSVECRQVEFTFTTLGKNGTNGTSETRGQFPAFLFSCSCLSP